MKRQHSPLFHAALALILALFLGHFYLGVLFENSRYNKQLAIPGGEWLLTLSPREEPPRSMSLAGYSLVAVFAVVIAGLCFYVLRSRNRIVAQAEELERVDAALASDIARREQIELDLHVQVKLPQGEAGIAGREEEKKVAALNEKGRNWRILLAEDDITNMTMLTRLLEKLGCEVTQAGNGLEAVQLMEKSDVDIVLMDIQMPVMDGIEATRRIRSDANLGERSRVPIIAVTAFAMSGDRERFLQAGMNDYLAKPLSVKTLVAAMDRAVAGET